MMDTIKLKINNFKIRDRRFFIERNDYSNNKGFWQTKMMNNRHRKWMIANLLYAPRYWTESILGNEVLVLELSLPKLIFGTNLNELSGKDFDVVVDSILFFLSSIRVDTDRNSVINAVVTKISYSRNIDVTPLGSANQIIKILSNFDYRPRSDYYFFNNFNNKKNGYGLRYANKTTNFTIYDKMSEILSNPKTWIENQILNGWKNKNQLFNKEIIRIEITLRNKTAIRQALKKINNIDKKDYSLGELYSKAISDCLLLKEVKKIYNNPAILQKLNTINNNWQEVTRLVNTKKCSYNKQVQIKSALMDIQSVGYKSFQQKYIIQTSRASWYRLKRELDLLLSRLPNKMILNNQYSAQDVIYYISLVLRQ